jgi:DtxR family transcriptional regulator, Mn-dependent transcriptional regulator
MGLSRIGKALDMTDLIDTTEMYLRTVYELIEDGVVPMRARIAEQFGHSGPTVSQTVARMERDGLLFVAPGDHHLELTDHGRDIATRVMRKHRLAERLLADVIGLNLAHVHEEACRWEHVMSDLVEERLLALLDDPLVSPYGNAIPGLGELGVAANGDPHESALSLEAAVKSGTRTVTVLRLGEAAQAEPGLLDAAIAAGIWPGASLQVGAEGDEYVLSAAAGEVIVSDIAARHIFVVSA